MPWFDPHHRALTVRIAYDGPALSGKSTNVFELAAALRDSHAAVLLTDARRNVRTEYFDLAEVSAGWLGDWTVRCQLVSVPGQVTRTARRVLLVQGADAVVFVCDSRRALLRRGRATLAALRAVGVAPAVLQANYQDAHDALAPGALRDALRLPRTVPAVAAVAVRGEGIRETLYHALQAVRARYRGAALPATGAPESAADLAARLRHADETDEPRAVSDALGALEAALASDED